MARRAVAPTLLVLSVLGSLASAAPARAAAPPSPTVSISSLQVTEGNAGLTTFKAQVALLYAQGPFEIDISAVPNTASASDFVFQPAHLTLAAGVTQEVSGAIVGDAVFEGDETFTLFAKATGGFFLGSQGGTVTITDDDQAAAPKLSVDPVTTLLEGNDGLHAVGVRVQLQPASTNVVEVDVMTGADPAPGGAFGGSAMNQRMVFEPGQTSQMVQIQILGDKVWENDTTIPVTLSNPHLALLGNAMGKLVITNDDAGAALMIDDMTITEGNAGTSTAMVRIRFNPPAPGGGKVHLTIMGGAADDGADFTGGGFHVIYPIGGEKEMTYPIEIVGDTRPECDEGLSIEYRGVYLGDDTTKTAHLTIADDDGGPKTGCPDLFKPSGNPPLPPTPPDAGAPVVQDASPTPPKEDAGKTSPPPPATPDAGAPPSTPGPGQGPATGAAGSSGAVDSERLPDRGCTVGSGQASTPSALLVGVLVVASLRLRRRRRSR